MKKYVILIFSLCLAVQFSHAQVTEAEEKLRTQSADTLGRLEKGRGFLY